MSNQYDRYSDDYMAEILKRSGNSGNYSDIQELWRERDKKIYDLYGNDFQAEINRRSAEDPSDPLINDLERLRREKIYNDPGLMQKYGDTVYPNQAGIQRTYENNRQTQVENLRQSIKSALAEINLSRNKTMDQYIGVPGMLRAEAAQSMRQGNENLAQMGLSSSGLSESARLKASANLGNNLLKAQLSKNAQLAEYDRQEAELLQKGALEENNINRQYENELLDALREDKALADERYESLVEKAWDRDLKERNFSLDERETEIMEQNAALEKRKADLENEVALYDFAMKKDPNSPENQKMQAEIRRLVAEIDGINSDIEVNNARIGVYKAQENEIYYDMSNSGSKSSSSAKSSKSSSSSKSTSAKKPTSEEVQAEINNITQRYREKRDPYATAMEIFSSKIIPEDSKWIVAEELGVVEAMPIGPFPSNDLYYGG